MVRWWRVLIAVAMLLAVGTACTREPSGGFDPATLLRIENPEDGAQVSLPVTIRLSSSVPLGDEHFVQVFIDGLEGPTVTDDTFELTDLQPGQHGIHVSLMNEDGSPAGGEDEIQVTVTEG